jgi:hypothetical protein
MCILSLLFKLYHIREEISIPTERNNTMPKIIITRRYLKKGTVKKSQNYVKYIATREDSVPVKETVEMNLRK